VNPWEKGVWCLTIGLTAAVLVRLYLSGLSKIYILLSFYLASDVISSIVALFFTYHSNGYAYYYFAVQTLRVFLSAFILIEIYSRALERHPALARFGRSMVGYILVAAAVIPMIGLLLNHSASGSQHYFQTFLLFERTTNATMAIFLVLISLFLGWFPVRMRRNVIVYISGFVVLWLARTVLVHVISLWVDNRHLIRVSNTAEMCVTLICLSFWTLAFRREGEARTAVVGHLWNRAEAERLTEQLNAINEGLARMGRK
jgi:hypothetical protein